MIPYTGILPNKLYASDMGMLLKAKALRDLRVSRAFTWTISMERL